MCARTREGIFLKCKNVYTRFTPSLVVYFPIIILHFHHCSILPYHHRTLFLPLSHFRLLLPSAVSLSPTILFPPLPLFCFHQPPTLHQHALPIRAYVSPALFAHFSQFWDIYFTKSPHLQEKSALFFDFVSLSPHILPYTYRGLLHLVPLQLSTSTAKAILSYLSSLSYQILAQCSSADYLHQGIDWLLTQNRTCNLLRQ